jgi:hypothetical protein
MCPYFPSIKYGLYIHQRRGQDGFPRMVVLGLQVEVTPCQGVGGGGRQVLRGEVTTCGHTAKSCSLFLILSDWSCDDTLSRILLGADDKR